MKKPPTVLPRALSLTLTSDGDGTDVCQLTVSLTDGNTAEPHQVVGLSAHSVTARFADSDVPYTTVTTNILGEARAVLRNTVTETITVTGELLNDPSVTASTTANFVAQGEILQPPTLREASGGNIDTTGLASGVVHVDIPAWDGMADGNVVTLSWTGTLSGGGAGPAYTPTHVVTLSESGSTLTLNVDIGQYLTPFAGGGQLHLSYTVNGRSSGVTDISVDGSAGTLTPPSVDEAEGTRLPTDLASVNLRIPAWPGMAEQDLLYYYWLGNPAGGGNPLSDGLHIPATLVGQDVTFMLDPAAAVVPFEGSTVETWYQVTAYADGKVQTSRHATLQVGEMQVLPAPEVEKAENGILDVYVLGDVTNVRIAYPGIDIEDILQLIWKGTLADEGGTIEYRPSPHVVTQAEAKAEYMTISLDTLTHVTWFMNGSVEASYILTRSSGPAETSSVAKYQVPERA